MSSITTNDLNSTLSQYWGYDSFRPNQLEIIQSVVQKNDVVAVLPTGGGKSLCYQLPGLLLDGITVVISPLIALMQEQVNELNVKNIPAACIHSGMKNREIDIILDNCIYGNIKFLYLSPERLKSIIVTTRLKKMMIGLIAIDEAHCISQWGYDFRPNYLLVEKIRTEISLSPIIALTATATHKVVKDIKEKLSITKAKYYKGSFYRPNIAYTIKESFNKQEDLLEVLNRENGHGIIYLRNRKKCEQLSEWLNKRGFKANFYHAGLAPKDRLSVQKNWLNGKTPIMVCTNAFGMGINKTDLRWVIHFDLPGHIEDYYQESGRIGRDQQDARAYLFWNQKDVELLKFHHESQYPPIDLIRKIYQVIVNHFQIASGELTDKGFAFDIYQIAKACECSPIVVFNTVKLIEKAGYWFLTETELELSKLQILLNNHQLQKFAEKHPVYDELIKTCLRSYSGLFAGPQSIHEEEIAERQSTEVQTIIGNLQKLDHQGVVSYQKKNFLPHIVFLRERVKTKDLVIPHEILKHRKAIEKQKMDEFLLFIKDAIHCRQQVICKYFEETLSAKCGQCDNCLNKNKGKNLFNEIEFPCSYEEISKTYGSESETIKRVRILLEEGRLILFDGIINLKG